MHTGRMVVLTQSYLIRNSRTEKGMTVHANEKASRLNSKLQRFKHKLLNHRFSIWKRCDSTSTEKASRRKSKLQKFLIWKLVSMARYLKTLHRNILDCKQRSVTSRLSLKPANWANGNSWTMKGFSARSSPKENSKQECNGSKIVVLVLGLGTAGVCRSPTVESSTR